MHRKIVMINMLFTLNIYSLLLKVLPHSPCNFKTGLRHNSELRDDNPTIDIDGQLKVKYVYSTHLQEHLQILAASSATASLLLLRLLAILPGQ